MKKPATKTFPPSAIATVRRLIAAVEHAARAIGGAPELDRCVEQIRKTFGIPVD